MKSSVKAILSTLIFGLVSGLSVFIILSTTRWTLFQFPLLQVMIWACLAMYGVLLVRWSGTSLYRILFPLALPLLLLILKSPSIMFFVCCLFVLSWMRSGICFPGATLVGFCTELATCFGGAALVSFFSPRSVFSFSLGIWLFFLVQSLYFVFNTRCQKTADDDAIKDPFDKARHGAEVILGLEDFKGQMK